MKVTRTITVEQTGVGKPDYSREVSSAIQRAGVLLGYLDSVAALGAVFTDQVAHPYSLVYVLPSLAPGDTAHLIDEATGAATLTTPAGYAANLLQYEWTNSEDFESWIWLDGLLLACPAISPSGDNQGWNMVIPVSSLMVDVTASSSHEWDITVINRGGANLEGGIDFVFLLEPWGTEPLSATKDCHCPFCHHIQTVATGTVRIICTKCGKLYIVRDYSKRRKF